MIQVKVIYCDDDLMVIDKPAGLVVDPSETQKTLTLAEILQSEFGINLDRGGIVHRLDKDTSGLLLVAKKQEVLEALQAQFKERTVKKEYLALVHGLILEDGTIDKPIGRNPGDREKFVVLEDGKEAVTEYQPISNFKFQISNFKDLNKIQTRKLERSNYGQFTLVRCFPKTGRTHQIRVHLKYIGHPIVGDEKYAGRKTSRLDHRLVGRQFLHAAKLEFSHPGLKKRMSFESPLPEDLNMALEKLT
ncbi:MAG: Pseudouridine synthase [Candidatus Daviesbacteria bacterium GW2011_GWA2_38_24]|uniref:Pseudouridine synthase n=1 Tax=Candidatus Daviesbacteria bacterium GW2011_GWA2_38_24 TaxID=1618422 RepID=A0A0G0JRR9_9BACT|nr:MAG: Pseudouridine synthase [Candidatus Daviesbacteria bacterium GW2011_GWA2_38_24]KKQ80584.1 MAG: Pseudouridine synthase [Candidatus Daviesbacteria bacterium GW2011_GWA1_38_7]OGE23740.1 MAG: hypothetical protein A2688_02135 [Candidatus Daviesbacteria bacterium RIFCSPHIGHO2_01_FULL_38_8]